METSWCHMFPLSRWPARNNKKEFLPPFSNEGAGNEPLRDGHVNAQRRLVSDEMLAHLRIVLSVVSNVFSDWNYNLPRLLQASRTLRKEVLR